MKKSLDEISNIINGKIIGSPDVVISGISGIQEAKEGDITFVANSRYMPLIEKTNASAIIVPPDIKKASKPLITVKDPSLAFAQIVKCFYPVEFKHPQGIDKTAVVCHGAKLGKGVALGAYVVVEEGACIGDNTVCYPGTYIGKNVKIGKDCLIHANVSIRERVEIGDRVSIQSGTVIGSEGFGYVNTEGALRAIPQVGIVVLEDDVDIGANVTIDRARFDKTVIGSGTKIDNLVQIAHNVIIGKNCIIVAQAGISGSTHIGNNVIIAGQAGLVGHITIGDEAILAAQAGVTKSVPEKTMVSGYPARPHQEAKKINACVQRLPKLIDTINELKEKVRNLEEKMKQ